MVGSTKRPTKLQCWNCGISLDDVPRPISRHEHCKDCFEALHCCRLCRHYRTDITAQCDEDRADPPPIKENANFCDWFRPASGAYQSSRTHKSDTAKERLGALFAQPTADTAPTDVNENEASATEPTTGEQTKEAAAKEKLDSLFGKPDSG